MKKFIIILLVCILICGSCLADDALMGERQEAIYLAVKYCMDVPKNAQIVRAMEYACNPGMQMHMLLIQVTQNPEIETLNGFASKIIMVDLDREEMYTYRNIEIPDQFDETNPDHLRGMIFNAFDSYLKGINEFIWMDSEIKFELDEEEVTQINARLLIDFMGK